MPTLIASRTIKAHCRDGSSICSVALRSQAPQPRSGAPKARGLTANARTELQSSNRDACPSDTVRRVECKILQVQTSGAGSLGRLFNHCHRVCSGVGFGGSPTVVTQPDHPHTEWRDRQALFFSSLETRTWPQVGCSIASATTAASISSATRFLGIGFLRLISASAWPVPILRPSRE